MISHCLCKTDIGKGRVDRITGSSRETGIGYEFDFELLHKSLSVRIEIIVTIFEHFFKQQANLLLLVPD